MSLKTLRYWLFLAWFQGCIASAGTDTANTTATARMVSSVDMMSWSLGLLIVLAMFFLCVWGLRKAAAFGGIGNAEKMRVLSAVALGMREKVVLLQVGKKQLILGVTPGRIETLHVLEGADCLLKEEAAPPSVEAGFAGMLKHIRQGRSDA